MEPLLFFLGRSGRTFESIALITLAHTLPSIQNQKTEKAILLKLPDMFHLMLYPASVVQEIFP